MLSYYTKRSKGEGFHKTSAPHEYTSWIHGSGITREELDGLISRYNLTPNIVHDVRDVHELPRVEYGDKGYLYMFLRVPRMTKRGEVETSPLLAVVRGRVLLTLATGEAFQPEELMKKDHLNLATTSTQLALLAVTAVVAEYEELIHKTSRDIKDVSHRLRKHDVTNRDFVHFVTIEDNLNEYTTNLDGMQALMRHLRENRRQVFSLGDEEMIDDILLHIQQLLVAVSSNLQSVTSIRNAYSTIANNSLNQRMKTLTVLTVLIALPNVFYGMYGMNVALPFAEQPWAYSAVVVFTIVIIIVVYILARRFKIF